MSGPSGATQQVVPDPKMGITPAAQVDAVALPATPPQPTAGPAAATPVADPASWAPTAPVAASCPWCSSVLPEDPGDRCPACGANLVYGVAAGLPGVTEVAPASARGRNAEPLKRSGQFPPIVTHMIAVGEKSGQLEQMLESVADSYDAQVEVNVQALTSLLEPLMIVVMGAAVGFIAFSIMMPLIQMNEFVQ